MGIRLALVTGNFRPELCGVAHYVGRLARELANREVQTVILTSRSAARETPCPASPDGERSGGVPIVGAVDDWRPSALLDLARAVARAHPDVVHIQYAPASYDHSRTIMLAPPLLRLLGKPTVVTIHEYGGWDARPRFLPAGLVRRLARLGEGRGWWDRESLFLAARSDRVIVTNVAHRDLLVERLRALGSSLRIIPIGPNVPVRRDGEQRRMIRAELGMGDGDPLVCFFGFLHPVKGIDTLLRAFALLRQRQPTARLLLVGGDESLALRGAEAESYRGAVRGLIDELGIRGSVAVTGFLPDPEVSARLLAADVCALPFNPGVSLKSGSLLAALAHGLPTVVTRGELPAPSLVHGEHVLAVPPGEPEALAAAVDELLRDPDLRGRLRAGALALAATHDWPAIASQHLDLYAELLARRASTGSGRG